MVALLLHQVNVSFLQNLLVTRSTIANLYLPRRPPGIREDRQCGVIQITLSYPLNKTSKSIPGLF